ncbi:FctA domain-containing protein [Abiotrophia defectiva]|uniref:Spy0128 family protein n=1 Tax=Abiotrophia defectiva TaxID=46125 RepID=UPI0026F1554C|nr:FctA domain-containing protein [Abiotrophia defectiva]
MKKHKLHSLLIVLLMVLQVFASPLVALAQEAATPASPATEAVQPTTENAANGEEGKEDSAQEGDAEVDAQAGHFPQAQVQASQYEMTTDFTINTHPVQKNGKYGEGKFYIAPTYKIPNKVTLKNGDTLTYTVPNVFQVEDTGLTEVSAGGQVVGNVVVDPATNTATLTITNEAYFAKLNEEKTLTMSFTAVWADSVPKNVVQNFTMPGAGDYALTRIVVDEDPTGYTKWGVQNKDNPELIDWRIRVNRYAKAGVTNAVIKDAIPEGQEFVGEMTGYYFTDWENGTRVDSFAGTTIINEDDNNFTVIPNKGGSLDGRGLYLIYQTRITEPVDPVTKRATNHVSFTSDTDKQEFDGFAPLKTTDGVGTGARSDVVVFQVNKKLEGRQIKAQEFDFQLVNAADNSVVATAKNDENGLVKFKKVKFKTEGEFTYKIREVKGDLPGVTYDENEITATVKVTDKAGAKTAQVTYDRQAFTNTYKAAATSLVVKASKKLAGATLAADQFTFELVDKATGQVVGTAKNKADGSIEFPALNYDAVGSHTYTIREKNEGAVGYTYDSKTFEVTVDVTDNGQGQLVASPTYVTPAEFSNSYQAAATSLVLKTSKKLTGSTLAADQFTFELVDKATGQVVGTAKNKADGSVEFPALNYDAVGNHTYTIREKNEGAAGYTYDAKEVEVTVAVTDNGQGQLEAKATYASEEGFANTYKAAATSLVVKASKKLAGATLAADQFTFELVDKDGKVVGTAKNKADGSVEFPALSFDAAGDYSFKIREKNEGAAGYTYDASEFDLAVAVTDNGQGQLEAKASYAKPAEFSNSYKAGTASLVVDAKTVIKKGPKEEDVPVKKDQFTLELVDKDGKVLHSLKNDENGKVVFPALTFDAAGEYTYTLRQVKGSEAGMTYDDKIYTVKVTVSDNGQGQLLVQAENATGVVFVNRLAETSQTEDPGKDPGKKEEKQLPKTGEASSILLIGLGFVLAIAAGLVVRRQQVKN